MDAKWEPTDAKTAPKGINNIIWCNDAIWCNEIHDRLLLKLLVKALTCYWQFHCYGSAELPKELAISWQCQRVHRVSLAICPQKRVKQRNGNEKMIGLPIWCYEDSSWAAERKGDLVREHNPKSEAIHLFSKKSVANSLKDGGPSRVSRGGSMTSRLVWAKVWVEAPF